ncbi:MAG: PAS domain S-box protein, partial [Bacteroidota bacterium]
MRQSRASLLEEIENLKKENRTLQGLYSNLQNPELLWWARHNAEFIITLSGSGEMLSVSSSVTVLMGYSPAELTGKGFDFFIHPQDIPLIRKSIDRVGLEPESTEVCHVRGKHLQENWLWLEANVINQVQNTEIAAVMIVFRLLRLAKEIHGIGSLPKVQYSDLYKAIKDGLLVNVLRGDGTFGDFIEVNDFACRMLGYTRDEILEMSIKDIGGTVEDDELRDFHKKLAAGESVIYESSYRAKNGNIIPVEIHASLFRFENQRGMVNLVRDITERLKTEEEKKASEQLLKESEEQYRTLFTAMAQGVVYQDADGNIFQANPAAERILGLRIDQMKGRASIDPRWHAIHEDGSPFPGDTHPAMISLKTGKQDFAVIGVFNPSTEQYNWINVSAEPLFRPGETTPFQVFTTFEDVTGLKSTLSKINRANERLEILRRVDRAIMQSDLFESAVDEIAMKSITGLIPCQEILLITFDFDKDEAVFESRMLNGIFSSNMNRRFPLNLFDISMFEKGKNDFSTVSPETVKSPVEQMMLEKGYHSVISTPLSDHKKVVGLFILLAVEPDSFIPEHLQIAEDIASQISLNLHKRELNIKLQAYTSGLEKQVEERTREIMQLSGLQQAILNNAGLAIISTLPNGTISTFNAAAEKMLGYTADEVIGKIAPVVFHDPDDLASQAAELSVVTGDNITPDFKVFSTITHMLESATREWTYIRKDGSRFPVKLTISTIRDSSGSIAGYIGVAMDMTQEK